MANPFSLIENNDKWTVLWQTFPGYFFKKKSMLDVVFDTTQAHTAGFLVRLNNNDRDTLWVDRYDASSKSYGNYLQSYYVLDGVVFFQKKHADDFHTWLEKEFIWQRLKV